MPRSPKHERIHAHKNKHSLSVHPKVHLKKFKTLCTGELFGFDRRFFQISQREWHQFTIKPVKTQGPTLKSLLFSHIGKWEQVKHHPKMTIISFLEPFYCSEVKEVIVVLLKPQNQGFCCISVCWVDRFSGCNLACFAWVAYSLIEHVQRVSVQVIFMWFLPFGNNLKVTESCFHEAGKRRAAPVRLSCIIKPETYQMAS